MADAKPDRETWLARAPIRSPEMEQAIFGGDVGEAADTSRRMSLPAAGLAMIPTITFSSDASRR